GAVLLSRIGKADIMESKLAPNGPRELNRLRGRDDTGSNRHDLANAARRACGLRDLVSHFRQLSERASAEHGEQNELRERAPVHAAGDHLLRSKPKHDDHAAESEEDGSRGDD